MRDKKLEETPEKKKLSLTLGEGAKALAKVRSFLQKKYAQEVKKLQDARKQRVFDTITWLCETFPKCFNLESPKPLKRRIEKDIFPHRPKGMTKRTVRKALTTYAHRQAYLENLLKEKKRYNLEGNVVENVLSTHRDYTKVFLQEKRASLPKKGKDRSFRPRPSTRPPTFPPKP